MKKLKFALKLTSQKGQSLVEMAITAPILIFMLLGVFEVGWALRGYLVLTNVNRELTRFSIRPGYLDYSLKDDTQTSAQTVGYAEVLTYANNITGGIPLNFTSDQTSTLIISHLVVDTNQPCVNLSTCDCNAFLTDPNYINSSNVLTLDDLVLYPGLSGYRYFYVYTFPFTSTYRTKLNYPQLALQMKRENNKFNCELLKKSTSTLPSSNNVVVTEIYYNQPQLFGFPVISNPFTDPVPMYAHTTMRMIVASRSGENVDNVGPICDAYPFALISSTFTLNNKVNIVNGGWLKWNSSAASSNNYLINALTYSRMPLNDFKESGNPGDTTLNVGDQVASLTGFTWGSVITRVQALVQKEIRVPVGSGNPFTIGRFAKVRIESNADIVSSTQISATYLGDWVRNSGDVSDICLPSD